MRASCRTRFRHPLLLCGLALLCGCVQIKRFRYIVLEPAAGIRAEGTSLPTSEHVHLVSVSPMPAVYVLSRPEYSVRFVRAKDYTGGLVISAFSAEGSELHVTSDEAPLSVPGYGACRAYYTVVDPTGLLFFDLCPQSVRRSFELSFNVQQVDGAVSNERLPYSVRTSGFWWTPDSL
jgi:hypothetical protein